MRRWALFTSRLKGLEQELEEYVLNELEDGEALDGATVHTGLEVMMPSRGNPNHGDNHTVTSKIQDQPC